MPIKVMAGGANGNTTFYLNNGSTAGDHQGGVRYGQRVGSGKRRR